MRSILTFIVLLSLAQPSSGQCVNGLCPVPSRAAPDDTLILSPLSEELSIDITSDTIVQASDTDEDRLDRVTNATVRVTVGNDCGSGTIVGRDSNGAAIVLTNAHVAGTKIGRVVNVQRWNQDGDTEKGQGRIISAGYSKGLNVDFALVLCGTPFANGVRPIPLADRYPDGPVTTCGSPRCEWPSMQTIKMDKKSGQILIWKPQAISGRSGSSLIDYNPEPRVIGLITWGGQGQGLGQSTPFILEAIKGKMPMSFEALPMGITEMKCQTSDLIDRITEGDRKPDAKPQPDTRPPLSKPPLINAPREEASPSMIIPIVNGLGASMIILSIGISAAIMVFAFIVLKYQSKS